jgi:hypothetical protein
MMRMMKTEQDMLPLIKVRLTAEMYQMTIYMSLRDDLHKEITIKGRKMTIMAQNKTYINDTMYAFIISNSHMHYSNNLLFFHNIIYYQMR